MKIPTTSLHMATTMPPSPYAATVAVDRSAPGGRRTHARQSQPGAGATASEAAGTAAPLSTATGPSPAPPSNRRSLSILHLVVSAARLVRSCC